MNKNSFNLKNISSLFDVKRLDRGNLDAIYSLCRENTFYYKHCQPFVTQESICMDMKMLPPGKTEEDKYYVGFFEGENLVAVLDLIDGYPEKDFCFVGFFMLQKSLQNKGLGGFMIEDMCNALDAAGYKGVKLAWVETNFRAEKFWKSHGFVETGAAFSTDRYRAVVAERVFQKQCAAETQESITHHVANAYNGSL